MDTPAKLTKPPRYLAVYTLGFLQVPYIRRMLAIAGWQVKFGPFCKKPDAVGVWGRKPLSKRGFKAAKRRGLPVISIEDAFLRSTNTGPSMAPAGLIIDETGLYFDAEKPSTLENILNGDTGVNQKRIKRAAEGIAFLRNNGLSKYNPVPRGAGDMPEPGYVLIVDQTEGDAAIRCGNAGPEVFVEMLRVAKAENPDKKIVIRTHPAVSSGKKTGHFSAMDCDSRTVLLVTPVNPWDLLESASKVYCVTSQLGFEAIMAGHRPRVFGMPFYAGWGLSDDQQELPRRKNTLSKEQLFAGAMLDYPTWIDPFQNRLCSFEDAAQFMQAKAKLAWMARPGYVALGMSSWKIPQVSRFLGYQATAPVFEKNARLAVEKAKKTNSKVVVWASKVTPEIVEACDAGKTSLWRMEDGFLRSVGLGAELTPADSVVLDDLGIYFDATRASRLEKLIAASVDLPDVALVRAERLRQKILTAGVTKYNLEAKSAALPDTKKARILVPGQVEDDASIRLGTTNVCTNSDLLIATRQANPDAFIIYKPHPDVEAGLRPGQIKNATEFADLVVHDVAVADLLTQVDAVWTMTSLLGFEALLRAVKVTCLGMPFYAGWGLTDDGAQHCSRRLAKPTLAGLIHASLIDYPVYLDPVSKRAISVEGLVERLRLRQGSKGPKLRLIAKLQGHFARFAHLWR